MYWESAPTWSETRCTTRVQREGRDPQVYQADLAEFRPRPPEAAVLLVADLAAPVAGECLVVRSLAVTPRRPRKGPRTGGAGAGS